MDTDRTLKTGANAGVGPHLSLRRLAMPRRGFRWGKSFLSPNKLLRHGQGNTAVKLGPGLPKLGNGA